jgi:hypothetical protein
VSPFASQHLYSPPSINKRDSLVSSQLRFAFVGLSRGECHLFRSSADICVLPFSLRAELSLMLRHPRRSTARLPPTS